MVDAKQGGIGAFRVAPDGRSMAYTRRLPGAQQAAWTLVVQEMNGRPRELLRVTMPDYLKVHAWTPDGQGILFTRATGDQPHQLWLMPVEGGGPIDLQARFIRSGSSEPNGLSLHPDGRQIAYPERVVQSELWLTAMGEPRDGPAGR